MAKPESLQPTVAIFTERAWSTLIIPSGDSNMIEHATRPGAIIPGFGRVRRRLGEPELRCSSPGRHGEGCCTHLVRVILDSVAKESAG